MVRYLLFLSYIGTRYRGAQKHVPNQEILDIDSIQGAIESGFLSFLRSPRFIVLSSRTDSGVHALQTAVHTDFPYKGGKKLHDSNYLISKLNRYMIKCEHDIRIHSCIPVTNDFHARFSAKSRTYEYRFCVAKKFGEQRFPIMENCHTFFIRAENFDIEKVKEGIKLFHGTKNFETFSGQSRNKFGTITYVRKLHEFTLEESHPLLASDPLSQNFNFYTFHCKGRSFLYNQVRRMVGSLLSLGAGLINEQDIRTMLEVPSHHNWNSKIRPAPPHGLYLKNVEYDPEQIEAWTIKGEDDERLQSLEPSEQITETKDSESE